MRMVEDALAEQMKNPKFREEYDALERGFAIIQTMIHSPKISGLT